MAYGWLTNVADTAYSRMRDLRPEKNLQHNREIAARETADAARKADEEYQALLDQERQAQEAAAVPAVTAAPQAQVIPRLQYAADPAAKAAAWEEYVAASNATKKRLLDRVAKEGAIPEDEMYKAEEGLMQRRQLLLETIGSPEPGSAAWQLENKPELSGETKGFSISGGASQSRRRAGASEAARSAAENYMIEQFGKEGPDTRRSEIYLRNLEQARNRVLSTLWGTEGATRLDDEIATTRAALSGKDATKLEIARMNNSAKMISSFNSGDAQATRSRIMEDGLKIKEFVARSNDAKWRAGISQKDREEFGRNLRNTRDNLTRYVVAKFGLEGTMAKFMRDASTPGGLQRAQQQLDRTSDEYADLTGVLAQVTGGAFTSPEAFMQAVQDYGQYAGTDDRLARPETLKGEPLADWQRSGYEFVGLKPPEQEVAMPGYSPGSLTVTGPYPFGKKGASWQSSGSPAQQPEQTTPTPAATAAPPPPPTPPPPAGKRRQDRGRLKNGDKLSGGTIIAVGEKSYLVKMPDGSRVKVPK